MKNILPILFVALTLSYCSNNQSKNVSENSSLEEQIAENESSGSKIPAEIMEHGEEVYKKHCQVCHQTNGSGNPGMYPPLDDTEMVNGDKDELIEIILNGMSGEIEVKGEIYNQVMIPHNFLSDKEIADLLTYVRNSFGNSSSPVTEEEVAEVRAHN